MCPSASVPTNPQSHFRDEWEGKIFSFIYIYIYKYVYTKIKKPKTRCAGVNVKRKNTFSIVTNISVVLHNLLQCIYICVYVV